MPVTPFFIESEWPALIGITGRARTGKDTAADCLSEYGYARYSMAAPLKDGLRAMLGLTWRDINHPACKELVPESFPECGVTTRSLMQTLGTEWGRQCVHPDLWVLIAERRRRAFAEQGRRMVVPDIRFDNEADWIRERGGVVIHLLRPDAAPVNGHSSEDGVTRHASDLVIVNRGTVADLHTKVVRALVP